MNLDKNTIFGYDKYFKLIKQDCIVKFEENGRVKAGHIFRHPGYDYEWTISYNHCYGEASYPVNNNMRNFKIIGFISDSDRTDEKILQNYFDCNRE